MTDIETINELDLTDADNAAIGRLLQTAFDGGDFGGRSFFVHPYLLRVVVRVEGRIVGHVGLTLLAPNIGGQQVQLMAIGDVAVEAAHRKAGIAGRLLERSIAVAKAHRVPFLALFGIEGIYHRAGFRPVPNTLSYTDLREGRTVGTVTRTRPDFMVLEVGDIAWNNDAEVDLLGPKF